jgi:hypothetical protein
VKHAVGLPRDLQEDGNPLGLVGGLLLQDSMSAAGIALERHRGRLGTGHPSKPTHAPKRLGR